MEVVMLMMTGVAIGCAAYVVLPQTSPSGVRQTLLRARLRRAVPLLARVGSSRGCQLLLTLPRWEEAARLVAGDFAKASEPIGSDAAGALLAGAGAAVAVLGAFVSQSPAGVVVGVLVFLVAVPSWTLRRNAERRRRMAAEMPAVFRSLASALGSGQTLAQAIAYVGSRGTGPVHEELARSSLALTCGESGSRVLEELAGRVDAPGIGLLAVAMSVSQRTGSPLRDLFLRSALLVERQGEYERELLVKTAQVRLSARLVSAMPALMVGLLVMISPDFRAGLISPVGLVSVGVAALLDAVALTIIGRLMKRVA